VPENRQLVGAPNMSYDDRLKLVYFNSSNVPPHRIRYNGIVDLPFGRGKAVWGGAPAPLNHIIGGWQVATIGDWRSGLWITPSTNLYQFGDPRLDADQRVEMTFNGTRQRLWFRGFFDPTQATSVTGGDLLALVPVDRNQRVLHQLGPNFNNQIPLRLANGTIRNTIHNRAFQLQPEGLLSRPGRLERRPCALQQLQDQRIPGGPILGRFLQLLQSPERRRAECNDRVAGPVAPGQRRPHDTVLTPGGLVEREVELMSGLLQR